MVYTSAVTLRITDDYYDYQYLRISIHEPQINQHDRRK
jgi:hypothetical protein